MFGTFQLSPSPTPVQDVHPTSTTHCSTPPYPTRQAMRSTTAPRRQNAHAHACIRTHALAHTHCLRIWEIHQITRRKSTPAPRRPRRAYITVSAGSSLAVCIDSLKRYGVHRTDGADSAFILYCLQQLPSYCQPRVAVVFTTRWSASDWYTSHNLRRQPVLWPRIVHCTLLYLRLHRTPLWVYY